MIKRSSHQQALTGPVELHKTLIKVCELYVRLGCGFRFTSDRHKGLLQPAASLCLLRQGRRCVSLRREPRAGHSEGPGISCGLEGFGGLKEATLMI